MYSDLQLCIFFAVQLRLILPVFAEWKDIIIDYKFKLRKNGKSRY